MRANPGAWALTVVLASIVPLSCSGRPEFAPPREWPVSSGDPLGRRYSPLDEVNRSNVSRLEPAWVYRTGDMTTRPPSTIQCTPIVVDGTLYLTTPGLKVVALDAGSGRRLWEFDPFEGRAGRGVNRGVTFWRDGTESRIFTVAGPYLYALDPSSGRPNEAFGEAGRVDLRLGLDREASTLSVTANSPGVVFEDLLILGSVVGEGPTPAAPGHVRAFDVRTGGRRWVFHTIPHPGEPGHETWPPDAWKTVGGANAWGGFTLDIERGLVFFGTGSASYDHWGGNRIGQNLYANSVVALRARTGGRVWHFQAVHHDLWDYDLPCPPVLVKVRRGEQEVAAAAQATKMGHLFLLDRATGEPLFPVEERPVPRSAVPGEESWPTQPFPTRPPPVAQQRFTPEEATDLSPEAREAVRERLASMRTGDVFLPPGPEPSVVLPQFNGGNEWGGSAFDPASGLLYVNASNEAELTHLGGLAGRASAAEIEEVLATGRGQMPSFASLSALERRALAALLLGDGADQAVDTRAIELSFAAEIPWVATGHNELRDPEGFPVNQRPWGTLTAVDLGAGAIRWQVPLGTYPELEARGLPPTGTFNIGGPLVTAGGLVFIGAAMDERFHAFDAETGDLLWEYPMEAGGYASPATFEVDGRQHVVIAAGGGGKPGTPPGDAYYCFALPRPGQDEDGAAGSRHQEPTRTRVAAAGSWPSRESPQSCPRPRRSLTAFESRMYSAQMSITYSFSPQRKGQSSLFSGKSGFRRRTPGTTPPAMNE